MTKSARVKTFSLQLHIARLRQTHGAIKSRIAGERKRPAPCSLTLQSLKRQRLKVKDELAYSLEVLRDLDPVLLQKLRAA